MIPNVHTGGSMESGPVALARPESDGLATLFPMVGAGFERVRVQRRKWLNSYKVVTACQNPEWINTGRQCRCGKYHFDGRLA